jgi:hypothetical protein
VVGIGVFVNVVFVHLGQAEAEHLWANLRYLKYLNSDLKVSVILTEKKHLKSLKALDVEVYWYTAEKNFDSALNNLTHDSEFRDKFWRFSVERILALSQWHNSKPNESFLHIESDVLCLRNFPWKEFSSLESLAWLRHNAASDCAAILYSPRYLETNWLANQVILKLKENPTLTDMTALSEISHANRKRILILPSLHPNLVHTLNQTETGELETLSEHHDLFGGVFDPAAFGVWLTGNDPRNALGWIKKYTSPFEPTVDPAEFNFHFGRTGIVSISKDDIATNLYNLHIHSKQNSYFSKYNLWRIGLDILYSGERRFPRKLALRTLLKIVRDYISNGKLTPSRTFSNLKSFHHSRK